MYSRNTGSGERRADYRERCNAPQAIALQTAKSLTWINQGWR